VIDLIRQYPRAFLFSLLLHGSIIALTLLEFSGTPKLSVVSPPSLVDKTIKAEVIDQKKLDQRAEKIKQQEQERKRKQQAIEKRAKEQAIKQAQEKKRALEQKKKAEAEKKKQAEAEKKLKAEQARRAKAEAEKKLKAEQQKKAEEEKKRKAEEARKKAEAEKQRKAEELKRKQEQERLEAERQARLKAEAEQRQKEAELKARLAAEERQRTLDTLRNKYYAMIKNKIQRNWRQPVNAGSKPECEVKVKQGPGGIILDVTFGSCPGTREYRLSVEAAVLKSDPLPRPEDPELFQTDITLRFKPEN
jgi:colicin import membrane protein